MRLKKKILSTVTALLVFLFLYTALSKFLEFGRFTSELNSQPFPDELTPFLVWLLPVTELSICASLLVSKWRYVGFWASLVLMSLFTAYTAMVLMHGFDRIPCSCGGVIEHLTWLQHLAFNLFFVLISTTGIYLHQKNARQIQSAAI